jgi:hypothetical protein
MQMIVMYVRNGLQQKIGVIVAIANDHMDDVTYSIGWSKCNKRDKFDRNLGIEIATMRALMAANKNEVIFTHKDKPVPRALRKTINIVSLRSDKYFKRRYH